MNTITARTAHADQLHADLRDRTPGRRHACDALDRCDQCKADAREVAAIRHAERVAAAKAERIAAIVVPAPRLSLLERIAAAVAA